MRTERLTFVNAAITAGNTSQIERSPLGLLQSPGNRLFLRQVVVGVSEGVAGILSETVPATDVQPILAKVYLAQPLAPGDDIVSGTSVSIPMDEGYLRSGSGQTSQGIVGMVGMFELHPNASLAIDLANDTANTLNAGAVVVHVVVDIYAPAEDVPASAGFVRLSTQHWARWAYRATITNGAGGAGNQTYTITPFKGSYFIPYLIKFTNGDTVARVLDVAWIDEDGNTIAQLVESASTAAASFRSYPRGNSTAGDANHPNWGDSAALRITEGETVLATAAAVAASQDTAFAVAGWVCGRKPSVGLVGASTPTTSVTVDRLL